MDELSLLLQKDLGLVLPEVVSEAEIMRLLVEKVSDLLRQDAHRFYQLMYRLDIPEQKLNEALRDEERGVDRVAAMIYKRQLEKANSRRASRHHTDEPDELAW